MVAAMPAAYIAPVGNILGDQTQGCGIFAQYPIDAQTPDLFFECHNRKLELSLLQRDGNQLVWKWRALLISDKRVEKRQAVLTSGNPDIEKRPIARPIASRTFWALSIIKL